MRNVDRLVRSGLLAEKFAAPVSRRRLLGSIAAGTLGCAAGSFATAALAAAESAAAGEQVTEAQRLGQFAADISFEKLPASTVLAVKRLVLDTLGCALGAIDSEPARIAETVTPSLGPSERGATIIGSGRRATASGAAFVNGTQVRFLDFLDVYFTKDVYHPSENIPPAIACVEEAGGSGHDLIGIVVGYEAEARLCDVLSFPAINMRPASAAIVVPLVAGAWRQSAAVMAHGCVLGGARHLTLNALLAGDLSMARRSPIRSAAPRRSRRQGLRGKASPARSPRSNGCSKLAQAKPGSIRRAGTVRLALRARKPQALPIQYALQAGRGGGGTACQARAA